jgi:hypothetical protein
MNQPRQNYQELLQNYYDTLLLEDRACGRDLSLDKSIEAFLKELKQLIRAHRRKALLKAA